MPKYLTVRMSHAPANPPRARTEVLADGSTVIAIAGALKWSDGYTPVLSVPPDPRLPF
ncbi:MAG: hypothetical protein RJA19_1812 [Bacteroidota bacterium]